MSTEDPKLPRKKLSPEAPGWDRTSWDAFRWPDEPEKRSTPTDKGAS